MEQYVTKDGKRLRLGYPTGTTYIEFSFIFRVEIQQNLTLQRTRFQTEGTIHTRFFVLGNQGFQRTMLQVFRLEHRHDSGYTHTIISS